MFNGKIEEKFIVFEGIDGAGKSSLIHSLHHTLHTQSYKVYTTYEPSKGFAGKIIRDLLSKKDAEIPINNSLFAYLYAADRYEHIYGKEGILSQIKSNNIVLCDRYFFSSYVYQGIPESLFKLSIALNKNFPIPSVVFFLDLDISTSMERLHNRETFSKQGIHGSVENVATLMKMQDRYHDIIDTLSKKHKVQCHYLDANKSVENLTQECMSLLEHVLKH